MNLQQGCSGSWCHTAARSSLGSWCVGQSFFSDLGIAHTKVWPMVQSQHCPSEGQRGQLDEAIGIPPAHMDSITQVCVSQPQPGAPCTGFFGRAINAQPYSTAAAPHQCPWSRWLQELTPLSTRCGCFHPCSKLVVIIVLFS